jgi:hypothetical protein
MTVEHKKNLNKTIFMKNKNSSLLLVLSAVTLLAAASAFAGGNNGIKGASPVRAPSAPAKTTAMACPMCKDEAVTVAALGKGSLGTTVASAKHQCPSCATTLVNTGVGKAAKTESKHTSASCCSPVASASGCPMTN